MQTTDTEDTTQRAPERDIMSLPRPLNWLKKSDDTESEVSESNNTLMLFHLDDVFSDDEQMKMIIESRVFNSVMHFDDYEGLILESDREKVMEYFVSEGNYDFREFAEAYVNNDETVNWVWISDTLMTICDKLEFIDNVEEKDVRFWMLVQDYNFEDFEGQHYNREGICHMLIIETQNLGNWQPFLREELEVSGPGGVETYNLPRWIYDLSVGGE